MNWRMSKIRLIETDNIFYIYYFSFLKKTYEKWHFDFKKLHSIYLFQSIKYKNFEINNFSAFTSLKKLLINI